MTDETVKLPVVTCGRDDVVDATSKAGVEEASEEVETDQGPPRPGNATHETPMAEMAETAMFHEADVAGREAAELEEGHAIAHHLTRYLHDQARAAVVHLAALIDLEVERGDHQEDRAKIHARDQDHPKVENLDGTIEEERPLSPDLCLLTDDLLHLSDDDILLLVLDLFPGVGDIRGVLRLRDQEEALFLAVPVESAVKGAATVVVPPGAEASHQEGKHEASARVRLTAFRTVSPKESLVLPGLMNLHKRETNLAADDAIVPRHHPLLELRTSRLIL